MGDVCGWVGDVGGVGGWCMLVVVSDRGSVSDQSPRGTGPLVLTLMSRALQGLRGASCCDVRTVGVICSTLLQ